jgi:hypothetical protein
MATTTRAVVSYNTDRGTRKSISYQNPRADLTRAHLQGTVTAFNSTNFFHSTVGRILGIYKAELVTEDTTRIL